MRSLVAIFIALVPTAITGTLMLENRSALAQASPLLQVEGMIEDGDRVLPDSSPEVTYDEYTFEGQAGQVVSIVMESLEFDTYLQLRSPSGEVIAQNDNYRGFLFRNSGVVINLPENGTYTVIASFTAAVGMVDNRGSYEVSVVPVSSEDSEPLFSERTRRRLQAFELKYQGEQLYDKGQLLDALLLLEQALEIYRELNTQQAPVDVWHDRGDRINESRTLLVMGWIYRDLERYEQALQALQEGLEIRQALNHGNGERVLPRYQEGLFLRYIGQVYDRSAQDEAAVRFYRQALPLLREVNDHQSELSVLWQMGAVYWFNFEEYDQAIEIYQQALAVARNLNASHWVSELLKEIGFVYRIKEEYRQSLEFYRQSREARPDPDRSTPIEEVLPIDEIEVLLENVVPYLEDEQQGLFQPLRDEMKAYREQNLDINSDSILYLLVRSAAHLVEAEIYQTSFYQSRFEEIIKSFARDNDYETARMTIRLVELVE
ncbi:MAG: tetratricopeptide repeat protein, partial [Cyanothece sp. SIO2G6]|nr:tetratricopeptide repeat protein [Cyanothece sp. SIO2G6]